MTQIWNKLPKNVPTSEFCIDPNSWQLEHTLYFIFQKVTCWKQNSVQNVVHTTCKFCKEGNLSLFKVWCLNPFLLDSKRCDLCDICGLYSFAITFFKHIWCKVLTYFQYQNHLFQRKECADIFKIWCFIGFLNLVSNWRQSKKEKHFWKYLTNIKAIEDWRVI